MIRNNCSNFFIDIFLWVCLRQFTFSEMHLKTLDKDETSKGSSPAHQYPISINQPISSSMRNAGKTRNLCNLPNTCGKQMVAVLHISKIYLMPSIRKHVGRFTSLSNKCMYLLLQMQFLFDSSSVNQFHPSSDVKNIDKIAKCVVKIKVQHQAKKITFNSFRRYHMENKIVSP